MNKLVLMISTVLVMVGMGLHAFDKLKVQKVAAPIDQTKKPLAVQTGQPQVNPHQMPHASQADFQALINMVVAREIEDLLQTTLQHPILGTNKDDFLAALNAYRAVLVGIEKDPRIQALPTKTQLHAQVQADAKRTLTQDEKDGLLKGVTKLKNPAIYTFYLNTHPDIEHDAAFFELIKIAAQK